MECHEMALRLLTRNNFHARWSSTSHRNPIPTITETDIYQCMCVQQMFPNSLATQSLDLLLCDFWLWGYMKDNVYRERLTTMLDLKDSICCHFQNIHVDALHSVVESTIFGMESIVEHDGLHIEHVLQQ